MSPQLLSSFDLPPHLAYSLRKACHFLLFLVYSLNNNWSRLDPAMSDEEDIGLYSLSHKPGLVIGTPLRQRGLRRQSIVSIIKDEEKTPIKSPSHPSLLNGSPKISTRKLSRSNTLPRLASQRSDASADITLEGLGIVTMERERAEKLRRWILALVVG